jgi:exodeoxyribonuclease VII large subunit
MAGTYLQVPFKANSEARSLGARFDGQARQWYVPEGRDLAPFAAWLPAQPKLRSAAQSLAANSTELAIETPSKGMPLSRLLAGVGAAVAEAFASAVWVAAEVLRASGRDGHVYLELSERDRDGRVVAKAQAAIWASTAARIVPQFERATGVTIGAGIKVLLRARPIFKAQYGLTLEVDAIDPDYTLGDLEARKREIRSRLQNEGVFDNNRSLPAPWDFSNVLVVAPEQGAGLGDFQQEAARLERFGVCRFTYVHSRFQGEGAASEILIALREALARGSGPAAPDVIVILRGGGAVNDLAWLNDYALARFICDAGLPVFTGIGHQRDSTILDEVAHIAFDTPSKVIAGIELQISRRAQEAKRHFRTILDHSARTLQQHRSEVEKLHLEVKSRAASTLSDARRSTDACFATTRLGAFRAVHDAEIHADALFSLVRNAAKERVSDAKHVVPALLVLVKERATACIVAAKHGVSSSTEQVLRRAAQDVQRSTQVVEDDMRAVALESRRGVQSARTSSEALVREISGQGPQKTLGRGFAVVQASNGKTIVSVTGAQPGTSIQVNFHDGAVEARVGATK